MTRRFTPLAPGAVADQIARLADRHGPRVAVDGADAADPVGFAQTLVDPLRLLGRPAVLLRADGFWRDASLRLEYGHHDVQSYREGWLDASALRREVLDPLGPGGTGSYVPSLRDPRTNRSTREPARTAAPGTVVLVAGALLLGRDLDFDLTVHLALSPAALQRRTSEAWTVPALQQYDVEVRPALSADVVVRVDDPAHPAFSLRRARR